MRSKKELASIIPGLHRIDVRGAWSRSVQAELLFTPTAQVIYPYGAPRHGQRYTPKGGAPTTYLASDVVTSLAEVEAVVAPKDGPPVTIASNVWAVAAVDVDLRDVLDLTDPATQAALGTTTAELVAPWRLAAAGRGLPPTQLLGQAACDSGAVLALKAPSAKRPGGSSLVVFHDRLMARRDCSLEVRDQGRLRQRIPPL